MAAAASAQSIVDPRHIEFAPSGAPNALDVRAGTPLVEKYTLDIYRAGGSTLVQTVDLGNPVPDPDGLIRLDFVARLTTPLATGVLYEAVVNAVGSVETVSSARSETFAFSSACTPAISPTASALSSSAATTGTVAVTANASCSWTASSNASWITITANAFGSGNATIAYSVAANTGATSRAGTMTIGGQTFTVTQAGAPCTFAISPTTSNLTSAAAAAGTIAVTAATSCSWTATSNASWLTITNGGSGSGNGTVSYNVAANTDAASRTGTVSIAGQTFTVTQAGGSCVAAISPLSVTLTSSIAASGNVTVTASTGCSWTGVSNDSWITIGVGSTGVGNGNVSYNVAGNTGSATRTGTLTIGGRTFTITQPGAPCTFTLSPVLSNLTSPAAADGTVAVTSGTGCAWTATSNAAWITITAGASGTGSGSVAYTVAANTTTSSRNGTMTIAGKTFTVTQSATSAPSSCTFTLTPSYITAPPTGASGSITVITQPTCAWTATSTVSWVTVTVSGSGVGSGTVTYTVQANSSTFSRSALVKIGGVFVGVSQAAATAAVTPSSLDTP